MELQNANMLVTSDEESILMQTVEAIVNKTPGQTEIVDEVDRYFLVANVQDQEEPKVQNTLPTSPNYKSNESLPWANMCRICATISDHVIPIFDEEGLEHEFSSKIHKYLPIHVSVTDTLPLQLCYHCAATILAWHELSEGCLNAQHHLLQMQENFQEKQYVASSNLENVNTSRLTAATSKECSVTNESQMELKSPIQLLKKTNNENLDISEPDRSEKPRTKFLAAYCSSRKLLLSTKCPSKASNLSVTYAKSKPNEITRLKSEENVKNAKLSKSNEIPSLKTYVKEGPSCNQTVSLKQCGKQHKVQRRNRRSTKNLKNAKEIEYSENQQSSKENGKASNDSKQKKVTRKKNVEPHRCIYCDDFVAHGKKVLELHCAHEHSEFYKKDANKSKSINKEATDDARMEVNGKVYYHCKDCGKNLHSPYTFMWHVRIHTGERPFTCHLCGKQFRVNQGLSRHLRETHAGIKNFPCDICGRMFSTKRNAEDHRRIHTGERPYICNVCGKAFKQKASLFVHNRTHSNHFPFKCSYCEQSFRTKPSLMVHITKHTGEKPHACDICHRRFRIKYELKRHRLVHFDDKPWQCSDCNLSFRQKRYLVNHRKQNHKTNTTPTSCRLDPLTEDPHKTITCVEDDNSIQSSDEVTDYKRMIMKKNSDETEINNRRVKEDCEMESREESKVVEECERAKKTSKVVVSVGKNGKSERSPRKKRSMEQRADVHRSKVNLNGITCYKCCDCEKILSTAYNFLVHRNVHIGEKSYFCGICDKRFWTKSSLSRHALNVHAGSKNYSCDLCDRRLASKIARDEHRRTHAKERPYKCDICSKSFKQKATLYVHKRFHEKNWSHICSTCGRAFARKQDLEKHVVVHSDKKSFACDSCCKRFGRRACMIRHTYTHDKEKSYICPNCKATFAQERYLKNHFKSMHSSAAITTCTLPTARRNSFANFQNVFRTFLRNYMKLSNKSAKCTKALPFKESSSMRNFVTNHDSTETERIKESAAISITKKEKSTPLKTSEKFDAGETKRNCQKQIDSKSPIECKHCSKKFRFPKSFKTHMRIHTGEKPFTCHMCGKQFGQTGSLSYHLKHVHGGIKNHACDICGRSFAMKAAMEDHRRIHTGERPYICDSCGKTFKTKASLYIHGKTHTDEYPHRCTFCKKAFRWRQQMLGHLTIHTGEKNHTCDVCGKAFGVKHDLNRHKRIHSKDKPFECAKCGVSFGQKRYLKSHERIRHK